MQKNFPVKNDWILETKKNLAECGIDYNEDKISAMSKFTFKKLVKDKIYILSSSYLFQEKMKSAKCINLSTWRMQDYLVTDRLSLSEKRLL